MKGLFDFKGFVVEVNEDDNPFNCWCRFQMPIKQIFEKAGCNIFSSEESYDYQSSGYPSIDRLYNIVPQVGDDVDCDSLDNKDYNEMTPLEQNMKIVLNNMYWSDREFEENGHIGLVDYKGNMVVPPLFESCIGCATLSDTKLQHYACAVKENGRWKFVDRDGKATSLGSKSYDSVEDDVSFWFVTNNGCCGLVGHEQGREVVPCEMSHMFMDDWFIKNGKYGYYKADEDLYIEPEYDEFIIEYNKPLRVRKGDVWGYISECGDFSTELKDSSLRVFMPHIDERSQYFGAPLSKEEYNKYAIMSEKYRSDMRLSMKEEIERLKREGKIPSDAKLPFE